LEEVGHVDSPEKKKGTPAGVPCFADYFLAFKAGKVAFTTWRPFFTSIK
jgi:hypothetical protein